MVVLDRAEKIAGAALVLAVTAFAAAGNPHIVEKQIDHSKAVKTEIESPSTNGETIYRVTSVPGECILCTDNVNHFAYNVYMSQNRTGYCYSTKHWTTRSTQLVFYGFKISLPVEKEKVFEVGWNG